MLIGLSEELVGQITEIESEERSIYVGLVVDLDNKISSRVQIHDEDGSYNTWTYPGAHTNRLMGMITSLIREIGDNKL